MNNIIQYILARAAERSTWVGIISMLTASGIVIEPSFANAFAALGASVAGFILAVTADPTK